MCLFSGAKHLSQYHKIPKNTQIWTCIDVLKVFNQCEVHHFQFKPFWTGIYRKKNQKKSEIGVQMVKVQTIPRFLQYFCCKGVSKLLKTKKNGSGLSYITYTFIPLQFLGYFKLLEPFTNDKHHKTSQKLSHLKIRKVHSPKLI